MTCRVTVWTEVDANGVPAAIALLRQLDGQTLPVQDWELVLCAAPSVPTAALQFAASHRPNVRITLGEVEAADPEGEWLLRLAPEDRLEPTALSRLVEIGGQSGGHDLVTVEASHPLGDVVASPLRLRRRETEGSRVAGAVGDSGAGAPRHVVEPVPLRHAAGLGARPAADAALEGVAAEVRWEATVLRLTGRVAEPTGSVRAASVLVVGRASGRLVSYPAVVLAPREGADASPGAGADASPGEGAADGEATAPRTLDWSAGVPVSSEDADGLFEVWLELEVGEASDAHHGRRGRVGAGAKDPQEAPAVLHGRPVAVRWLEGSLVIDVGATQRSLLSALDPRLSGVLEDATGSLLTVGVPGLAHVGQASLAGSVVLGDVVLPAALVLDEGQARLQCRVGALPGRLAVRTRFGSGRPADSGCELVTSPTGEYTLVPAPRPVSRPATSAPVRERQRATGPVAALRRRVPSRAEPAVSRPARVRVLRGASRRMTGLR